MSPSDDLVRARIIASAEHLLAQTPAEFTITAVAKHAEVSRATFYRRFKTLDELKQALRSANVNEDTLRLTDTRQRILDAALKEFSRHGVQAATMQEIADQAQVAAMSVYSHFKDKEGLLAALLAERGPQLLTPPPIFMGDLKTFVYDFSLMALEMARTQGELLALMLSPDPITQKVIRSMNLQPQGLKSGLEAVLQMSGQLPQGVSADVAATCLLGMIVSLGVIQPSITGQPAKDPKELAHQITCIFLA